MQKAQTVFILSFFHAIVQERRNYIPQGWSKFYEFSYTDFKAGLQVLEELDATNIQYQTLYGLFENAIYGGRIDNEMDGKVLGALIRFYFSNNMLVGKTQIPQINLAIPQSNQPKEYSLFVQKLSETDTPSLFGLPNNMDKTVSKYNTTILINNLKTIQYVSSENVKFDKAHWG